jgi:hypothetical protein
MFVPRQNHRSRRESLIRDRPDIDPEQLRDVRFRYWDFEEANERRGHGDGEGEMRICAFALERFGGCPTLTRIDGRVIRRMDGSRM